MAFKMKFNQEELKGLEPVPPGIYEAVFIGFFPKLSSGGDSINFNGKSRVINHPELGDKRQIWANLNSAIPGFIQDYIHSFGQEMENQEGDEPSIPGIFDGDPSKFNEADPSTWVYKGPLLGQVHRVEVGIKDYQGKNTQDIIRFICRVPDCAQRFPKVKHSKDMRKKA